MTWRCPDCFGFSDNAAVACRRCGKARHHGSRLNAAGKDAWSRDAHGPDDGQFNLRTAFVLAAIVAAALEACYWLGFPVAEFAALVVAVNVFSALVGVLVNFAMGGLDQPYE